MMRRVVGRGKVWVLVCLVVSSGALFAQGPVDGALGGTAATGALVQVERLGDEAGVSANRAAQVVVAGKHGEFLFLRLVPGLYRVCVDVGVSCPATSATVQVEVGEVADVELGGASALPGAAGPVGEELLDSAATVATSVANDAADAADRVDPAAEGDSGAETRERRDTSQTVGQTSVSYAGLSPIEDEATLDGLSLRQGYRAGARGAAAGGPRSSSAYAAGAVRSVRVMPRTFSAQYGAAGAVTAAVTRSGGERLHGSAEVTVRSSRLAAANPFSVATGYRDGVVSTNTIKPRGEVESFGGAVGLPVQVAGLPVWMRSAAVFGAGDVQLRQETIVSTPAMVPGGVSFFALNPVQRALLGTRGVGAAAINAALDYLDSLTGSTERTATRGNALVRADVQPGMRDRVTVGYVGMRLAAPRGASLGQVSDAVVARGTGSIGDSDVLVNAGNARWLHIFSPRWNVEVRGQVAHDLEYETPHAPLPQEPAISVGGLAPQVAIAQSTFAYGTPASLGRSAYPDEQRVQVAAMTELRLGRHLLTAGGDWSRLHDRVASVTNVAGSFDYDSGLTGGGGATGAHAGGLVDWITDDTFNVHAYPNGGCPTLFAAVHYFCFRSFTQSFFPANTETAFVTHEVAAFVEDAVRLRPDLAMTLGVRWEYTLLPPPQNLNTGLDAELEMLGTAGGLTGRIPEDRNNAGPRIGVTYAPRWLRGTTVQVGAGSFFGQVPGATVRAALADTALLSSVRRIRITPVTETACPQVANQAFGYACAYTNEPPSAVAQTTSAVVLARRFRLPAVQRATLAVEHVWRGLELRAEYATAMALQLPSTTDLNVSPSTAVRSFVLQGGDGRVGVRDGETFSVPVYTARRFTDYGAVTAVVSHANATYHAATLDGRWSGHGALRGLALRGSYTFSKAIDDGPQQGATPRANSQFDPFVNGYDKGLSGLNFPQRFAGGLLYETRMEHGTRWLRRAASGWHVAALGAAGSGRPYSYEIFGGAQLSGGRESINGAGGATYLPTVGRNTLRMPLRGTLDFRASRDLALGGVRRLAIFAEAYNALNTQSVAGVETRAFLVGTAVGAGATPLIFQDAATVAAEGVAVPAFGTATSSTTGLSRERQVAIGVRLSF